MRHIVAAVAVAACLASYAIRHRASPPPTPEPAPAPADGAAEWYARLLRQRLAHLDVLHRYALDGRFPCNHAVPGRSPVFVDVRGTACAVGHLMIESGRRDLAAEIVRRNNLVRIMDVGEGPVLDWIRRSGFTQEECALIQPEYSWEREPRAVIDDRERITNHLLETERKLRELTPISLEQALRRLLPHVLREPSIDFAMPGAAGRLTNRGPAPLRVRASVLPEFGAWTMLAPGATFAVPAGALVEWTWTGESGVSLTR